MGKIFFTEEQKTKICREYLSGKSISQIHKESGYCRSTISNLLKEEGISIPTGFRKKVLPEEQQAEILKMALSHCSLREIEQKVGVSIYLITNFLEEKGVKTDYRKVNRKLKEDYFEKIDSEKKAYFLGLLYTDGSVRDYKVKQVRLQLQKRDLEMIEKFKAELNADCKIVEDKRTGKEGFGIEITNEKLYNDLVEKGIIPRKTYHSKKLPEVPKEFLVPFLRGLFDGDGSLSYKENYNEACVGFISYNYEVVEQFQETVDSLIGKTTHNKIILIKNELGQSYRCSWRGRRQVLKILSLLYGGSNIHLKRKYEKYLRLLSTTADKDIV